MPLPLPPRRLICRHAAITPLLSLMPIRFAMLPRRLSCHISRHFIIFAFSRRFGFFFRCRWLASMPFLFFIAAADYALTAAAFMPLAPRHYAADASAFFRARDACHWLLLMPFHAFAIDVARAARAISAARLAALKSEPFFFFLALFSARFHAAAAISHSPGCRYCRQPLLPADTPPPGSPPLRPYCYAAAAAFHYASCRCRYWLPLFDTLIRYADTPAAG